MLKPAMLYKEAIIAEFKNRIYNNETTYYSGWDGFELPEISDKFDGWDYRYAILDDNDSGKVIGYFCYTYDMRNGSISNFGLYSFDKNNSTIGKDVLREMRHIIKDYKPHRIEWRMVGGNPVEKHYDKFCKRYNGKKLYLQMLLRIDTGSIITI